MDDSFYLKYVSGEKLLFGFVHIPNFLKIMIKTLSIFICWIYVYIIHKYSTNNKNVYGRPIKKIRHTNENIVVIFGFCTMFGPSCELFFREIFLNKYSNYTIILNDSTTGLFLELSIHNLIIIAMLTSSYIESL